MVTAHPDEGATKRRLLLLLLSWPASTHLPHLFIPSGLAHAHTSPQTPLQKAVCNPQYALSVLARNCCAAWNCVYRFWLIPLLVFHPKGMSAKGEGDEGDERPLGRITANTNTTATRIDCFFIFSSPPSFYCLNPANLCEYALIVALDRMEILSIIRPCTKASVAQFPC